MCAFSRGVAYFCMGAYKHDVVVVIKMDTYIHGAEVLLNCYNKNCLCLFKKYMQFPIAA